jgi:hypothetical protein
MLSGLKGITGGPGERIELCCQILVPPILDLMRPAPRIEAKQLHQSSFTTTK